jgi:2-keto-4-pentenoate hydratase/2-oxohepta-3-ene-1,7-dioic acid hydratase in catechol pathway
MRLASVRLAERDVVAVGVDDDLVIRDDQVIRDDRVLALDRLLELAGDSATRAPHSMRELIGAGPALLAAIAAALHQLGAAALAAAAESPAAWYPPVRHPGKILAVAMNNSASNERKISAPDHPAFFLKPPSCLIGHGDAIRIRPYYGSVHPEPELALVIGRSARDLEPEQALDVVFGYTIFNDITSNGMRAEDRFHYWAVYASKDDPDRTERVEQHLSYAARYKGTDTFGVLGPWLVTRDAVGDPDDLGVHCEVGGETIADDSTRFYNYKVAEVLSFISRFQTLQPGDMVSLGTAFKPGAGRRSIHHANFQTVAGPVSVSIEGLGRQQNPVEIEHRELGRWRLR